MRPIRSRLPLLASVAAPLILALAPPSDSYHDAHYQTPAQEGLVAKGPTTLPLAHQDAEQARAFIDDAPEHILRLRLSIADRLIPYAMPPSPALTAALAAHGIHTTVDLRVLAVHTRAARELLLNTSMSAGADAALERIQHARIVVNLLYPGMLHLSGANHIAAVLDAAASYSDHMAVEEYLNRALKALERREISQAPYTITSEYPTVQRPHPEMTRSELATDVPIIDLLDSYGQSLGVYHAVLEAAASKALTAVSIEVPAVLPTPAQLAHRWETFGHRRVAAVLAAVDALNATYEFGRRGPDSFDCSGLTSYAWAQAGLRLKTYSLAQREQTQRIEPAALLPGDLLFRTDGTYRESGIQNGHVALSLGWGPLAIDANSGEGRVRTVALNLTTLLDYGRIQLVEEQVSTIATGW